MEFMSKQLIVMCKDLIDKLRKNEGLLFEEYFFNLRIEKFV